jgi:predicted helicase
MEKLNLKPTHKPVQNYYEALRQFKTIGVSHEGAVRSAFQTLLEHCGRQFGWKLVPEWPVKRDRAHSLRVDGALVDEFRLTHGFWEAKDSHDDLSKEVKKKLTAGYPQNNIIFQAPERAILWQNGRVTLDQDITEPVVLVEVLKRFFEHIPPEFEEWTDAIGHFQTQVPELGRALKELIEKEQKSNARFRAAFDDFYALCRQSINPNLSKEAVEEMLIQHLLTERIFRTVFNNPDFTRRNAIAAEIEKVIDALTSQAFTRDAFLQSLDRFYQAIDKAARTIDDFSQKQEFLNTVYEKFFQGFSVKVADTHGIVYTPQPIVNFMVRSVEDILLKEFGKSLSSPEVHILDPFVGTGNFIVHIMQEIKKTALAQKYHNELHCNEVMLLPYYIASMNIEHEFYESTGSYESFEGICLVDTFELAEAKQISFFSTENTARVERQKRAPIRVVIGNPPYNAWQLNENDNNKNRKYKVMDRRVAETYAKDSKATLVNSLSDPYVKAIRWASDRIGEEGIVAFVSNNSFIENLAFDGMRKHLAHDFDEIYLLDLGGNVRKNPKLSGTTHNVFGIQVGVSINLFVRKQRARELSGKRKAKIHHARVDEFWRKEQKFASLEQEQHIGNGEWEVLLPDTKGNWLTEGMREDFETFLSIGSKEGKRSKTATAEVVFGSYGRGISTSRDEWVYDFAREELEKKVRSLIGNYNSEVARFSQSGKITNLDEFVNNTANFLKWTDRLKEALKQQNELRYLPLQIRHASYRPFTEKFVYFDSLLTHRRYQQHLFFPAEPTNGDNLAICLSDKGYRSPFSALVVNKLPELHLCASTDTFQCFPFYTYNEDGTNRRENITDWGLEQFRSEYKDKSITKWDIFHYVYAVLHHPLYREHYAANLKRELPRIPFAPDFRAFANIGKQLAEIHVNYEQQPECPLERIEKPGAQLDWRVERMKLSKDKRSLIYNDFLTLSGIPPEVFEYRLGNRSALEWIIDQYQVSTDKRSGITNDPNRADDPQYTVRLIGQVVTVSVETVKLVQSLLSLALLDS